MKRKPLAYESKTDQADLSTRIAGVHRNGHEDILAREILEERRNRLRKQNVKLDFDIHKQTQEYGDISELKRQVLRCNMVVKQSLFAMANRIAGQLILMDEEEAIRQFLHAQLSQTFNDLAFEHGGHNPPDS